MFCSRFSVETKKGVQNLEHPRYDYKYNTNHIEKYGGLKNVGLRNGVCQATISRYTTEHQWKRKVFVLKTKK